MAAGTGAPREAGAEPLAFDAAASERGCCERLGRSRCCDLEQGTPWTGEAAWRLPAEGAPRRPGSPPRPCSAAPDVEGRGS
ncbi:hypothetical protein NDU88_003256 [Pleurodeles waltl]|uniref:Uncharacterized protein n=1 Tax=Pleurodeles waltl TaxID=8319 RepID=A0AAV7W530_PLEWA|nr:hypothetical protein NDU88_003256 [Pleurodeles waltl]